MSYHRRQVISPALLTIYSSIVTHLRSDSTTVLEADTASVDDSPYELPQATRPLARMTVSWFSNVLFRLKGHSGSVFIFYFVLAQIFIIVLVVVNDDIWDRIVSVHTAAALGQHSLKTKNSVSRLYYDSNRCHDFNWCLLRGGNFVQPGAAGANIPHHWKVISWLVGLR